MTGPSRPSPHHHGVGRDERGQTPRRSTVPNRSRRPRVHLTERGSVSIEMVLLMLGLFTLLFLGLQAGLYYHARAVAIAAAQEGARQAGSQDGSRASGVAAAQQFLALAGGSGVIANTTVDGTRTATTATMTVTGDSMSVLPGVRISVSQTATVTVERLTQ